MKRETLRHPKTHDLCSRLGIDRPRALGILTLLWDFTADSAIQGDVGKWPNGSIARACDWLDDADAFVEALVEAKWIDRSITNRLIVHDWPDHCERWVRAKLRKLKIWFLSEYGSTDAEPSATTETTIDATPPRDRTEPNQTKPPPPTPSEPIEAPRPIAPAASIDPEWEAVVVELHGAGMARTQSAVGKARAAGCAPGDLRAVLQHFLSRKPAWEPGALHDRILELRPGQDPASLWPPPSAAAKATEKSEDRRRAASEAAKVAAAGEKRVEDREDRRRRLEAEHGPAVNALDADAIRAVLDEIHPKGWAKIYPPIPSRGIDTEGRLRDALLSHFDNPTPELVMSNSLPNHITNKHGDC